MEPGSASANLPPSSLIICSRNRPQLLVETIASILSGEEVPTEVVVIDQSPAPHPTVANTVIGRDCVLRYCWSSTVGLSVARNLGIAAASHDVLAFIDDDMYVAPQWYRALIGVLLSTGKHGIVTGQVRAARTNTNGGFAPSTITAEDPVVYRGRVGKDVLFAGNMAANRAVFDMVGSFDERLGAGSAFPGAEDNDFGFRLLEAGHTIHYVPDAIVYHRAWRTDRDYIPLYYGYGRGQGAFYAKHMRRNGRYIVRRIGHEILGYSLSGAHHLLQRQTRRAAGNGAAILGLMTGAWAWFVTQRRTQ